MKRIIEIPDKVVEAIQNGEDYRYDIHTAIAQSTPYNPSGDAISRKALKEALRDGTRDQYVFVCLSRVLEKIDNAPTVELERPQSNQIAWEQGYEAGLAQGKQERPQGEWVLLETDCDDGGNNRYECSECHYSDIHSGSVEVPYCWHCGAKMKGGAE